MAHKNVVIICRVGVILTRFFRPAEADELEVFSRDDMVRGKPRREVGQTRSQLSRGARDEGSSGRERRRVAIFRWSR